MKEGIVLLILVYGIGSVIGVLTFYEKLTRFEKLIKNNIRPNANLLHISLNFDTSEKLQQYNCNNAIDDG